MNEKASTLLHASNQMTDCSLSLCWKFFSSTTTFSSTSIPNLQTYGSENVPGVNWSDEKPLCRGLWKVHSWTILKLISMHAVCQLCVTCFLSKKLFPASTILMGYISCFSVRQKYQLELFARNGQPRVGFESVICLFGTGVALRRPKSAGKKHSFYLYFD